MFAIYSKSRITGKTEQRTDYNLTEDEADEFLRRMKTTLTVEYIAVDENGWAKSANSAVMWNIHK